MNFQKKAAGDPLRIRAQWFNGVTDLLNKQQKAKPVAKAEQLHLDCLRAIIGTSDPVIKPFTPVTYGVVAPLSYRGLDYMMTNKPVVEVSKTLTWLTPVGITQTPVKQGAIIGYVKTHGTSWIEVSTDAYDDVKDYGMTHLNIYPGSFGLRGAMAGPMRVITYGVSPYLMVELQDYKPSTILAQTSVLGIPAKVGTTFGSESCELRYAHPRTKIETFSGASYDIYNDADTAVEANVPIQAKIDGFSGLYFVDWEQCPASTS